MSKLFTDCFKRSLLLSPSGGLSVVEQRSEFCFDRHSIDVTRPRSIHARCLVGWTYVCAMSNVEAEASFFRLVRVAAGAGVAGVAGVAGA